MSSYRIKPYFVTLVSFNLLLMILRFPLNALLVPNAVKFSIRKLNLRKFRTENLHFKNLHRCYASSIESSGSKQLDVNALPDSKRRLAELTQKIESNLRKDVVDYTGLTNSLKDMEMV